MNFSFVLAGNVAVHLGGLYEEDILYNALPLYHSSAGMLALGPSFLYGVSVAIRAKFSATNFWTDCVKYKATVSSFPFPLVGLYYLFVLFWSSLCKVWRFQVHFGLWRLHHCHRMSQG